MFNYTYGFQHLWKQEIIRIKWLLVWIPFHSYALALCLVLNPTHHFPLQHVSKNPNSLLDRRGESRGEGQALSATTVKLIQRGGQGTTDTVCKFLSVVSLHIKCFYCLETNVTIRTWNQAPTLDILGMLTWLKLAWGPAEEWRVCGCRIETVLKESGDTFLDCLLQA